MAHPLASVARRLAAPPAGSDADLLGRFRLTRDEAAFAELVRRHGPAVRAVVRARLGNPDDIDDVVQAAFLVLARDAGKVRESVPGFVVRVAVLTALQHRRNLARRRTEPLPDALPVSADPSAAAETREHQAVVAEELAALPDRLRAVLVLCGLEGLTNAQAAARLGVPQGTVDSRLATAKRRLGERLVRRGLAASLALAADPALGGIDMTAVARLAVGYAAAGGGSAPLPATLLADQVSSAMTSSARLFALGMVAVAVTGTAGTALLQAPGDKPARPAAPPAKPALTVTGPQTLSAGSAPDSGEAATRAALARPAPADTAGLSLGALLRQLEEYGIGTRVDLPALLRAGMPDDMVQALMDTKVRGFGGKGQTLADVLADACAGVVWHGEGSSARRLTYWVSGNRVVLGPNYLTPVLPGGGLTSNNAPLVSPDQMVEQLVGPPVSAAFDGQTLAGAVRQLRGLSGANIVLDPRAADKATAPVAGSFDDVRLLTVLQVLGDMAGLKPVTLNNVYYLTDRENAAQLQKLVDRDLFGPTASPVPIPAGYVTDGYQYYPKPTDLKPVPPGGLGGFGAGLGALGGGGPLPGTLPVPARP
jgi:RNA polymerase sigma factor (sigma-70 family)